MPKPKKDRLPPGLTRRPSGRIQAQIVSPEGKRLSKTFDSVTAARNWKRDTESALAKGALVTADSPILRRAAEIFLAGAQDGTIRTRSRGRYKPSTIARYRRALDQHVLGQLGAHKLHEIRRGQLEQLVGRCQSQGMAANSVRNAFMPLQAIYRWAVRTELVSTDPTAQVELPLDRGRRDRLLAPREIQLRLDLLPVDDRALWGTALYAGLRAGELMALRWTDVDLAAGVIRVQQSHDPETRSTHAPKSESGVRRVPIPPVLRELLVEHRMRARRQQPLVFSRWNVGGRNRGPDGPFNASGVYQRARRRWEAQGLPPVSLHECRHTYASLMIAAGENAKQLQTYLGHSSITTTFDRYGHLMPGSESASAHRLQAFLDGGDHEKDAAGYAAGLSEIPAVAGSDP